MKYLGLTILIAGLAGCKGGTDSPAVTILQPPATEAEASLRERCGLIPDNILALAATAQDMAATSGDIYYTDLPAADQTLLDGATILHTGLPTEMIRLQIQTGSIYGTLHEYHAFRTTESNFQGDRCYFIAFAFEEATGRLIQAPQVQLYNVAY